MIETILADMILSVFSGIYYHILCAEHSRQGKKLAACVLSFIALNLVIDVLFLTPTAANNLITFILTSAFILFWIPWLYNVPKGRILLYVMIQYGILLLVSVPLVIVVPNLMLVPGLVFGTLIKVIVYVIACPICLRFVKRRRESGIFLLPVLLPLSNAVLLSAFVYPAKFGVLWYILFSLVYFAVAAFNGYALYHFGGKALHTDGRRKVLAAEYERLRLVSHDVRDHQLTMQILRNKGEDQRAQEYADKIERRITDGLK